jgi:hypothetical protein
MNWTIGLLSIAAVVTGTQLDRRRQRERKSLPRTELHRWEEEGGAVPVSSAKTAAQTQGDAQADAPADAQASVAP